jgi:WD40 repeat protein
MLKVGISFVFLLPTFVFAQEKKEEPKGTQPIEEIKIDHPDPVIYEKEIEPIFANKCMYCHAGNVTEGKFDMGTYEKLLKGGKRSAAITAGDSSKSNLYIFSSKKSKPFMPPKNEEPLTPKELALIKLWIDQGAKPPTSKIEKPKIVVGLPPASVKPVHAVAITPDGSIVASGRGNQIHLYNGKTGAFVKTLIDPNLKTPDGKTAPFAHIPLVESLAFSPDGKTLASGSFQEVILWEVEKGTIKQKITGFADRVVAIVYSPDGKFIATGGGAPTEDGEVKIFNDSGKLIIELKNPHSDTCFGLCFSPDNTKLATCGADKFVKTWEIPSGKAIKAFEGHTHHVLDVGWQSDGKVLASCGADNNIKLWDFEKGEQVRTINAHQKQVTRLVYIGKTTNFITSSGDQNVKMWNNGGGNMRSFTGATDYVYALAVSADGKVVITGSEDGFTRIYNGENGQLVKAVVPPDAEPKKEEPKKQEPKKQEPKKEAPKKK